ncbi:MAG: phospholipase D family protein [Magnetococcales bacterium]|nr:phospholipase D family protein [Magnetococcales bacterium]
MVVDGERLKTLVKGAQQQVLLCAPFIKVGALRMVLSSVDEGVQVRIVTRWRAAEVASGVSDLEVFELANERMNTELALLDDLHAKLYLADDEGLAGSANLTAAALGWAEKSNVELLLRVVRSDDEVARLLRRLKRAEPATYAIRSEIEAAAIALSAAKLDEGQDISDDMEILQNSAWLPRCAAPGRICAIYEDSQTTSVVEGTREDGLADIRDLHIPDGLSPTEFAEAVRDTLLLMPAFKHIIDRIPQGLTDSAGTTLVTEIRPDLNQSNAALQWRIVRDWISVFFQRDFEVAPDSFVTRLRSR